jgi:hypothetical protein
MSPELHSHFLRSELELLPRNTRLARDSTTVGRAFIKFGNSGAMRFRALHDSNRLALQQWLFAITDFIVFIR